MKSIAFIPDTLDVDELIRNQPPNIPHFTKEKLLQIIGLLCKQINYTTWQVYDGYVQIMSNQLLAVADDYLQYVTYLCGAGVISRDDTYRPSKEHPGNPKSIGYKFAAPHDSAKLRRYDLYPLPQSERRIYRKRSLVKKPPKESKGENSPQSNQEKKSKSKAKRVAAKDYIQIRTLYPFVRYLDELVLDLTAAYDCLDSIRHELESTNLAAKESSKVNVRLSKCMMAIAEFQPAPSRKVTIDGTGHRLHSPLTRLKKEFRYFLTYRGERLVSLDLKNSQPFLSLVLMNPDFWTTSDIWYIDRYTKKGQRILSHPIIGKWHRDRNDIKNRLPTELRIGNLYPEFADVLFYGDKWPVSLSKHSLGHGPKSGLATKVGLSDVGASDQRNAVGAEGKEGAVAISIVSGLISKLIQDESFTVFRDLVAQGKIYEEMVQWLRTVILDERYRQVLQGEPIKWNDNDYEAQRNVAKALMVRVMFGDLANSTPLFQIAKEMLRETFPLIYDLFRHIKKGNHKVMARLLQRIESFLILHACTQAIRKTNKPVPIWTIHDSIVTTERYEVLVKEIVLDTIGRYVGVSPSIGIEYWINYRPNEVTFLDEEPDEFLESDEYTAATG